MSNTKPSDIQSIIDAAKKIVIIQADNPDGDSLASSLALEQILGDMGKEPYLYCGIDMPQHLTYLPGWDRVNKELPGQFDASIIVDTSSLKLLESLEKSGQRQWIAAKPSIVIDHHKDVVSTINFATIVWNKTAVATGEVLYELAAELGWPLNLAAGNMIATSILSDSLGLSTDQTTARSIHIIAELVEKGVELAALDNMRRELMRKSPELVRYKGELLQRVEYHDNNHIATITIPWEEIEKYSQAYNPSMLVIDEMRWTENTHIAIAFKLYRDGKITAKLRANFGSPIANKLAEHFGGGGHPYASGFKITEKRPFSEVKSECVQLASQLIDELKKDVSA
ncbi:MAG: hypothetical protein JWS12_765 [Candidatus Saccharibacteria bacterium]|nr:hypothetical protein [Candidatus Saccharibacteria bacterium]